MNHPILTPEQVVPFLQHDDPIVRCHVLRYFKNTSNFGPLTAEHYWAVIDRFGQNEQTLDFATYMDHVPQTDASLERLLRAFADKPTELFEFHFQKLARDMELAVLLRNRDKLLSCPQLLPHVREHLNLRLSLLDVTAAEAWDRLMRCGQELGNKYAESFNKSQSDALIEAAARGGAAIGQQAMITLDDESAAEDWREIFAVRVLGLARYEPAIDALIEKLAIDADILRDETGRALARIGTPQVIERIVAFYPGKPWHVRLYTNGIPGKIKLLESEIALLKMLIVEMKLEGSPDNDNEGRSLVDSIVIEMAELGSLAGLDVSRRLIAAYPEDPEALDVCQCLLAVAIMMGVTLPEDASWRSLLKAQEKRYCARRADFDAMFRDVRDRWRKTGVSFPSDDDANDAEDEYVPNSPPMPMDSPRAFYGPLTPIRNTSPKMGRNDKCPCGSGKKYKKCCGK